MSEVLCTKLHELPQAPISQHHQTSGHTVWLSIGFDYLEGVSTLSSMGKIINMQMENMPSALSFKSHLTVCQTQMLTHCEENRLVIRHTMIKDWLERVGASIQQVQLFCSTAEHWRFLVSGTESVVVACCPVCFLTALCKLFH
jgi:hypothetical protein